MGAYSFDRPVERPVSLTLVGRGHGGSVERVDIRRRTLIVVVKPYCDGCRDFLSAADDDFAAVDVVLVSAVSDPDGQWRDTRPVLTAPEWIEAQRLIAAPSYALIDPATGRLIAEGAAFSRSQVAVEIAPWLA